MRREEKPGRHPKYLPSRDDYSFRQTYDCCDNLEVVFREKAEQGAEADLESCYKVILMTLLPVICSRIRAVFFTLALTLGFSLCALAVAFKLLLSFGGP